jgi:DNA-binding IclR family transcriptional regulator
MNVKSADRTLQILQLIAMQPRTHVQLGEELEIPKSSLTGLLRTIVAQGFLTLDATTRNYKLGSAVLTLAQRYLAGLDLVNLGHASVRQVSKDTGEATALVVRAGDEILIVAKDNGPKPIKRSMQVGERGPLSLSAAGRVFLAYMTPGERRQVLARAQIDVGMSPDRQTDLEEHLAAVRQGGIAYSREELLPGIVAMALPVFDAASNVAGSLSVSAPVARFSEAAEAAIARSLRTQADALSTALGHGFLKQ